MLVPPWIGPDLLGSLVCCLLLVLRLQLSLQRHRWSKRRNCGIIMEQNSNNYEPKQQESRSVRCETNKKHPALTLTEPPRPFSGPPHEQPCPPLPWPVRSGCQAGSGKVRIRLKVVLGRLHACRSCEGSHTGGGGLVMRGEGRRSCRGVMTGRASSWPGGVMREQGCHECTGAMRAGVS